MRDRVPGLVMLLFVLAGVTAGIRFGGDSFPAPVEAVVGALCALGAFFVLASLYLRWRRP